MAFCTCEYCEQKRKLAEAEDGPDDPWATGLLVVAGIVLPLLVILGALAAFAGAR